jgi:hypothetical protein
MKMTKIRIRATGQVTDMVPDVARAMINGGMAVEVKENEVKPAQPETMAVAPIAGRAVAPQQSPAKKPLFGKRRAG